MSTIDPELVGWGCCCGFTATTMDTMIEHAEREHPVETAVEHPAEGRRTPTSEVGL